MWKQLLQALIQKGYIPADPAHFKAAGGFAIADWELMNYTGIGPTQGLGTPVPSRVFSWCDPMPEQTSAVYQPGTSLSDTYALYLASLKTSGPEGPMIQQLRNNTSAPQYQMMDATAGSFPGYSISPGLNDFLMSSLQSVTLAKPPTVDFTLSANPGGSMEPPLQPTTANLLPPISAAPSPVSDPAYIVNLPAFPPFFGIDNEPAIQPKRVVLPRKGNATNVPQMDVFSGANAAGGAALDTIDNVRFQVQSIQQFNVLPMRWFSTLPVVTMSSLVDPSSVLAGKPLLGPNGILYGRVSHILVGFRRRVTVTGHSAAVAALQQSTSAAANAFNVGNFYFSAGAQTNSSSPDPGTVVFQDNTNAPSVLGLTLDMFGN